LNLVKPEHVNLVVDVLLYSSVSMIAWLTVRDHLTSSLGVFVFIVVFVFDKFP